MILRAFGRQPALTHEPAAYVALSRATSLQTLQVLNFDPSRQGLHSNNCFRPVAYVVSRVMVHETVLTWHEKNVERERKARDFEEEMDNDLAVKDYVYVDSD